MAFFQHLEKVIDDTINDGTSILITKQFIILDFLSLLMRRCKL